MASQAKLILSPVLMHPRSFVCVVHFWKHRFQYHTILKRNQCTFTVHFTIQYGTFLFALLVIDIVLQQPDIKTGNRIVLPAVVIKPLRPVR
jgi:hypothetical protein